MGVLKEKVSVHFFYNPTTAKSVYKNVRGNDALYELWERAWP